MRSLQRIYWRNNGWSMITCDGEVRELLCLCDSCLHDVLRMAAQLMHRLLRSRCHPTRSWQYGPNLVAIQHIANVHDILYAGVETCHRSLHGLLKNLRRR